MHGEFMKNQENKISKQFYNILVNFEERLYNVKKQLAMSGISKMEIDAFEKKILESTLVLEANLCYDSAVQMNEADAESIFPKQYINEIKTALESMIEDSNPLISYFESETQMQ